MPINIYDIIEIFSPWIAVIGCFISVRRNGIDTIKIVSALICICMSILSGYAVYLSYQVKYNILVYTIEHALMLFSFSYITFLLIKRKLAWFFMLSALVFTVVFFFQLKNFDPYHSFNGIVSGIFSYCLIVSGLVIFLFLARGENNIRDGYKYFATWFATALVVYCTSTFLLYIGLDYLTYQDIEVDLSYTLWYNSTYAELLFFLLIFRGYTYKSRHGDIDNNNGNKKWLV